MQDAAHQPRLNPRMQHLPVYATTCAITTRLHSSDGIGEVLSQVLTAAAVLEHALVGPLLGGSSEGVAPGERGGGVASAQGVVQGKDGLHGAATCHRRGA